MYVKLVMGSRRDRSSYYIEFIIIESVIAQLVKNLPAKQETLVRFLCQKDILEKGKATHSSILGLPLWLSWKESSYNAGDLGSIPGLGRYPGEGKDYPLQYSGLENSMDCIVHGVTKHWTRLSYFHTVKVQQGPAIYSYAINNLGNILLSYSMDNFRKMGLLHKAYIGPSVLLMGEEHFQHFLRAH